MILQDDIGILYVDDEEQSLKYFSKHFGKLGPIFVAKNAEKGLELFREHQNKIGIVLTDKVMPRVNGYEFLEQIKLIDDKPLRMLVTAKTNLPEAVSALNDGLIYTYLTKPWKLDELEIRLKRAKDRFWISREKSKLLKSRDSAFEKMLMAERVSYWETLAAGMNHYMRNALTGIQGFFDMIPCQLEEIDSPKDTFFWQEYYQSVDQQIAQVISLLDGMAKGTLNQGADASSLEQTTFDVVEIIKEIGSAETARETNIGFRYDGPEQIEIEGDEPKIMRLLSGLTHEAKRHIGKQGGEVEFMASVQEDALENSPVVSIKCFDNGDALGEQERKKLFDPFHVRSDCPQEFGVTLLACYFITYLHRGSILADREKGRNVVNLTLPISS